MTTYSLIRTASLAALIAATGLARADAPPVPAAPLAAASEAAPPLPAPAPAPASEAAPAAAASEAAPAPASGVAAPVAPANNTVASSPAVSVRDARWAARPVAAALLADARGGDDTTTVDTNANVHGAVSANSATNVVTGMNTIAGGSFANAVGLPVVIQNSGANVLIQNATVINLQLR